MGREILFKGVHIRPASASSWSIKRASGSRLSCFGGISHEPNHNGQLNAYWAQAPLWMLASWSRLVEMVKVRNLEALRPPRATLSGWLKIAT